MYGPGEVIFHKGELDYKIFFIQSEEVSMFLEKDGGEIFEMAKLNVIISIEKYKKLDQNLNCNKDFI